MHNTAEPPLTAEEAQALFLKRELAELRTMISKLEARCDAAHSYREKSSMLLEEALRAMGRLEQVCSV
jgi:hypothetical protein